MHKEALEFVAAALSTIAPRRQVVEFGAREVNGSLRPLFPGTSKYLGVDVAPGVGVDVVADAADFDPPFRPDGVVCCEVLEHAARAKEIVVNAGRILSPGGVLVVTAATDPRAPHSATDGGPLVNSEFYRNVAPDDLEDWLSEAGFRSWRLDVHPRGDVRAVAHKARDFSTEPLRLYVVVATLNGLDRTKELEAALASTPHPLRPIFIDNGSVDGTRPWLLTLPREGPVVLLNERNLGAAGAWNLGIRYAFENGAEAVVVCGNDAIPVNGAIERLVRRVEEGCGLVTGTATPVDSVGAVQAEEMTGEALFDDPDFTAFAISSDLHAALHTFESERAPVTLPSDTGLFDSRFHPAYYEDDDFLWRLRRASIPVFRDPGALFRHDVSLAVRRTPELAAARVAMMRRNAAFFESKWGLGVVDSPVKKRRPLNLSEADWLRDFGLRPPYATDVRTAVDASRRALGRRYVPNRGPGAASSTTRVWATPLDFWPLRILWCSNAPWVPTAYGQQTKLFVRRLAARGHFVAIHCLYGLDYGSMRWEGVPCFPRGAHKLGSDAVGAHAERIDADVVVSLLDVWPIEPELFGPRVRWLPWVPIDHEPMSEAVRSRLAKATRPIAMSRFGENAAKAAGLEAAYIPHGVDTTVFAPGDKRSARRALGLPEGSFILGMVAANKDFPSRKAFPQCFLAFAEVLKNIPDAVLFVHSMNGEAGGRGAVDLKKLAAATGILDSVVFSDQYAQIVGADESHMAAIYDAIDALLCPSFGEGFGIPILEAQACGTPVIVGDWTAMSELCFAGEKIAKADADPYWTPLHAWQFAPRPAAIAEAALRLRRRINAGENLRDAAREGASAYDADLVVERYWEPLLREFARRPR